MIVDPYHIEPEIEIEPVVVEPEVVIEEVVYDWLTQCPSDYMDECDGCDCRFSKPVLEDWESVEAKCRCF